MEQEMSNNDKSYLKGSFAELNFVNTAVNSLPVEENADNKTHKVRGYNYSRVKPTPKENPRILSLAASALELLDIDKEKAEKDPDTPLYLAGNKLKPGSDPVAHCYCGHQFGSFAGQLGDGRAITLGDIRNHKGELWELQFKGSGKTPYSRFADGKAVLRSSIREYLCSEAMWALGIPTTRAGSLIVTDTLAERDPLYRGEKIMEKCAVVLRIAPSFMRFGSFEIFKPMDYHTGSEGPSKGLEKQMMPKMLDYLVDNHFPDIAKAEKERGLERSDSYLEMFQEIVKRTAKMAALWQCYGFCHGVLNTDNMSVLGLTIDFGPFGWMDYFNKDFICNHSDDRGRYSYANQPEICKWNLLKLGEAMQAYLPLEKTRGYVQAEYDKIFKEHYYGKMREKLGLFVVQKDEDMKLIDELFDVMHENASDFTNTFRKLSTIRIPSPQNNSGLSEIPEEKVKEFADLSPDRETVAQRYKPTWDAQQLAKIKAMTRGNPSLMMMLGAPPDLFEKEEEKAKKYEEFMSIDEEQAKKEVQAKWRIWLEKYEKRLTLETAGIKSDTTMEQEESKGEEEKQNTFASFEELQNARMSRMNKVNPLYVLRNYMAEEAIRQAENGDYSGVNNLLDLLYNPFIQKETTQAVKYKKCPPRWAAEICVSCSS